MQPLAVILAWVLLAGAAEAATLREVVPENAATPIGKVVGLIEGLEGKLTAEGVRQEETHLKFQSWCTHTNENKVRDLQLAEARKEKFSASIEKISAKVQAAGERLKDLSTAVEASQQDLSTAAAQREKEASDFKANEEELIDAHDTSSRAISVLKEEAAKKPALLQQLSAPAGGTGMDDLVASLSAISEAASLSTQDAGQLKNLLLLQRQAGPEPDAYAFQSSGIVDLLEDMLDKTASELRDLRKAEDEAQFNFKLMRQSLEDQIAVDQKALAEQRQAHTDGERARAAAQGELDEATKDAEEIQKYLAEITADCSQSASDYEAGKAAREEELKVLKQGEEILKKTLKGSFVQTSGYSFVQTASKATHAHTEPLEALRHLARQHNSSALTQLTSRMDAALRLGEQTGADPLEKVRGMIVQMVARLEEEVASDLKKEEYCNEQKKQTAGKKEELTNVEAKYEARLEKAMSVASSVNDELEEIRAAIETTQKEQAEFAKLRKLEHEDYAEAKDDLEKGLQGVHQAQSVLRDYYQDTGTASPETEETEATLLQRSNDASSAQQPEGRPEMPASTFERSTAAGGGMISILEHAESGMAAELAAAESKESEAAEEYEKFEEEAKLLLIRKKNDVKHKTEQAQELKKQIAELTSDRDSATEQLAAVKEYEMELKEQCVIKGETYAERKAKREAEIEGLKDALRSLEKDGSAALLQGFERPSRGGSFLQRW